MTHVRILIVISSPQRPPSIEHFPVMAGRNLFPPFNVFITFIHANGENCAFGEWGFKSALQDLFMVGNLEMEYIRFSANHGANSSEEGNKINAVLEIVVGMNRVPNIPSPEKIEI